MPWTITPAQNELVSRTSSDQRRQAKASLCNDMLWWTSIVWSCKSHRDCILKDSKGNAWAGIQNGRLWWVKGYAWNGCSPKFYIGWPPVGKWVGTPDFKESLRGSLGHDILFQFSSVLNISIEDANYNFLKWLETDGFFLAEHYYDAVEMFGEKFWKKHPEAVIIEYV